MNNCSKCGESKFPGGAFVVTPEIKIKQNIKFFFFWLPINFSVVVSYCPKCGFLDFKI